MAHIYTKEIQVSSITHSKISGVDQTKLFRVLIKVNLKLERMKITKNPTSSSIDKERELQNIRINTINLLRTILAKKALMSAITMLFLILKF
jgi:hypothetical protein